MNHSLEMRRALEDVEYADSVLARLSNPHCYQAVLAQSERERAAERYAHHEAALQVERAKRREQLA